MRTEVRAATNATIAAGYGNRDVAALLRAIHSYAHRWSHYFRPVTSTLDPTGCVRRLVLRGFWQQTIYSELRRDIIPGRNVHEWSNGRAVAHFVLLNSPDRRYAARAVILKIMLI